MSKRITVSLPQVVPELGDKERNIKKIEEHATEGPDILIFPEMFLTCYCLRDKLLKFAESIEGKSVSRVSEISQEHGTNIVFGMAELDGERKGHVYNSAILCRPDGTVERYRKMHLVNFGPFEEYIYFTPGNDVPVFDTNFGKLGIQICFDIFFPELTKLQVLKGADYIAYISASPSATRPFFETVVPARAVENTVFVMYSNLVGTELNLVFWGGNFAVTPRGKLAVKGSYFTEEKVRCELNPDELRVARQYRPTIKETRKDVLESLALACPGIATD